MIWRYDFPKTGESRNKKYIKNAAQSPRGVKRRYELFPNHLTKIYHRLEARDLYFDSQNLLFFAPVGETSILQW